MRATRLFAFVLPLALIIGCEDAAEPAEGEEPAAEETYLPF